MNFDIGLLRALRDLSDALSCDLTLDEAGRTALAFKDGVSCTLEAPSGADWVFFHAPIGPVPADRREAALTEALTRNYFGCELPSLWLSLEQSSGDLTVCAVAEPSRLNAEALASIFLCLCNEVRIQRSALAQNAFRAAARSDLHADNSILV